MLRLIHNNLMSKYGDKAVLNYHQIRAEVSCHHSAYQ